MLIKSALFINIEVHFMRYLKSSEINEVSGAALNFGSDLVVPVHVTIPMAAYSFIENHLQAVINQQLSPERFMQVMQASPYNVYLEEFLEELDASLELELFRMSSI